MIPYNVPINARRMTIGVQGENNVRQFLFDVTEWKKLTGDIGTAEMVVQRRGDSSPYAATITMADENTVSWVPTSADTAKSGAGKIQLMWIADGQTVKTKIFDMKVDPALDYQLPDDSLDPWASWVPDVINAAAAMGDLPGTIADVTGEWLEENIGPTTPAIDKTLLVEGAGSDAKKTGEEISYLKSGLDNCEESLETIIGTELNISFTPTINGASVNGVTATCENGKLKVVGTATAVRFFLCLNGQNTPKAKNGAFAETLPAGRYIVHIATSGYLSETIPYLYWTTTDFSNASIVGNGDVIYSSQPIMAGIKFAYNVAVGTESNPGYYDLEIIPVVDKKGIVLTSDVPVIPDYADVDTYITPGCHRVTSFEHAATIHGLPVSAPGKLVCLETSQANRMIHIYFIQSMSALSNIRCRVYDGSVWTNWISIASKEMYEGRIQALEKTIKVRYESGSWGDATERINVYLPAVDGYVMIRMYHFIDATHNCNGWQIHHAYHADENLGNLVDLTISGEWECAVHLAGGRDDFSGGHTHGDEVMTGVTFLLDGAPVDISDYTTVTLATEFKIIQTSELYDPYDHETVIAEHGKEYVFSGKTMTVNQSLRWTVATPLTNCFLAMFLPSKNHVDRAAANCDFKPLELATSTGESQETITKHDATSVDMWDSAGGLSAQVSIPVYPTGLTGGDRISISDNGGGDYNKLYFKVCDEGQSVRVGDLWRSQTVYRLNYAEPGTE